MTWYYAENGQQKGPVADWDFASLARSGALTPGTLVWHEGLPAWQPLSQVRPDLVAGSDAPVVGGLVVPEQQKDVMVQQIREGVLSGGFAQANNPYGLNYAGFWIRVGATIIDNIIVFVAEMVVAMILFGSAFAIFGPTSGGQIGHGEVDPSYLLAVGAMELAFFAIALSLHVAYHGLMVGKWGATLGKMAVGIRVVRADGSRVSTGLAIGRAFAVMLNQFACSLTYLMVAFDEPERRGLHDHICGTRVVYK